MATSPITTVADFKAYAGISNTNQDSLIASLIPQAQLALGNFCNRAFPSQNITEYRDGAGSRRMLMVNYPITAVSSVYVDGVSIPLSTNPPVGAGYSFPPLGRAIYMQGFAFSRGIRNCVISLTAGYGDAGNLAPWPDDLVLACHMYMQTRLQERARLGIGSKALAGESITYADAGSGTNGSSQGIPAAARLILENYLNTVPENGL
jgi:hypothetical protein